MFFVRDKDLARIQLVLIMGKFMVLILGWLCITLEIRMLILERLISSWAPAESHVPPSQLFLSENGP